MKFYDSVGTEINIGDKVHYVPDPEKQARIDASNESGLGFGTVWTSERKGIVFDYAYDPKSGSQSVSVHEYGDGTLQGGWARDEFVCDPKSLKVTDKARYGYRDLVAEQIELAFQEIVGLMNEPHDSQVGQWLDLESGRSGLQRAVHVVDALQKRLGLKSRG